MRLTVPGNHDDIEITRMSVSVNDGNGQIENGEAEETPPNGGRWIYTTTSTVPQGSTVRIAVMATDQPGGAGETVTEKAL